MFFIFPPYYCPRKLKSLPPTPSLLSGASYLTAPDSSQFCLRCIKFTGILGGTKAQTLKAKSLCVAGSGGENSLFSGYAGYLPSFWLKLSWRWAAGGYASYCVESLGCPSSSGLGGKNIQWVWWNILAGDELANWLSCRPSSSPQAVIH